MEHVSSVRPSGKFPEKVENLKRWSRFPGWNFRTECRVPLTFLVVCTSSRSTVGHPATYRGLRPNGTTFYRSEIPLLLPPKFPGFSRKWKAPSVNGNQPRFPAIIFSHPAFSTVDYSSDIFTCFKVINAFKRQNSWNEPFQKRSTYFRLGIPRMVCGFVSNITV